MKHTLLLSFLLITWSSTYGIICNNEVFATTPTDRFTFDKQNNTVTDSVTKLVWMRCTLGQTGNDCLGEAKAYTWAEALNEIDSNHSEWRLPNIKELASIVEQQCYKPAINMELFPNTKQYFYWSSTPERGGGNTWSIDFRYGEDKSVTKNDRSNRYVRLVRDE